MVCLSPLVLLPQLLASFLCSKTPQNSTYVGEKFRVPLFGQLTRFVRQLLQDGLRWLAADHALTSYLLRTALKVTACCRAFFTTSEQSLYNARKFVIKEKPVCKTELHTLSNVNSFRLRLEEQEIFIFARYHNLHCLFVVLLAVSKPSKDKKFLTLGASLDTGVTNSKASFIKLLTKRSATVTNTLTFSTICHEKQFRDWITTLS